MPEYRRARAEGGTYFFTVAAYERRPILTHDAVRQALREGIELARTTHPFKIEAWVLLPDHLHCMWTLPENDADFSARWGITKRYVSRHCRTAIGLEKRLSASRLSRKETGIWQRRFWEHQIRDETDFSRHVDYIHWNPVKHGYVKRVADWPHSTFHRFVEKGIYPADWGGCVADEGDDAAFGE